MPAIVQLTNAAEAVRLFQGVRDEAVVLIGHIEKGAGRYEGFLSRSFTQQSRAGSYVTEALDFHAPRNIDRGIGLLAGFSMEPGAFRQLSYVREATNSLVDVVNGQSFLNRLHDIEETLGAAITSIG